MPHFHHVNLGVPVGGIAAQTSFLTDVLGFRPVPPPDALSGVELYWFGDDEGIQIHLSADPDHRPAARAHVAVTIDDLPALEARLAAAGTEFTARDVFGNRIVFCADPSGNRWELRDDRLPALSP